MNMITTMFIAYNLFFPAGIRINCTIFLAVQLISLVACSFKCGIDGWFSLEPSNHFTVECQCPGNQSSVAHFRSLTISRSTAYAANQRVVRMLAIGPRFESFIPSASYGGEFVDTDPERMIVLRTNIFETTLNKNSGNYTCTAEGDNFEINYTISLQFTDICLHQVSSTPSSMPHSVTSTCASINTSTITSASTLCVTSREASILIVTIIPIVCNIINVIFICIAVASSRRTTSQQAADGTQAASSELGFPIMPSESSQNLIMLAQGIDDAVPIDNQPGPNSSSEQQIVFLV